MTDHHRENKNIQSEYSGQRETVYLGLPAGVLLQIAHELHDFAKAAPGLHGFCKDVTTSRAENKKKFGISGLIAVSSLSSSP